MANFLTDSKIRYLITIISHNIVLTKYKRTFVHDVKEKKKKLYNQHNVAYHIYNLRYDI